MSVLATVTLVVVPLAVGCITAAQHWCYRRRLNANLAKARADRARSRAVADELTCQEEGLWPGALVTSAPTPSVPW